MTSILAVFEKGIFRPVGEVALQEGATVRIFLEDNNGAELTEARLGYPRGFFERFAGGLAHEAMERPAQPPLDGDLPA
jgi:predicted DNA-binding antitoxin AbrB/MazE fold protein